MSTSLTGANIVLVIANGFNESEFADVQRALLKTGATIRTVSTENSLANGWLGNGWGHYFPVDCNIGDALGSDYDMMVLVGGSRSVAKLASNPHTTRMVGHFLDAHKPLVAMNEAVSLLSMPGKIDGRSVAGDKADARLATTGAVLVDGPVAQDGPLLTIQSDDVNLLVSEMISHFAAHPVLAAA